VSTGFEIGLVASAAALGFRHGVDWDHIAALTDITGTQERGRRSLLLATVYALGHAAMVFVLGVLAIVASAKVPSSLDHAMSRVVGVTLLVLGAYVLVALVRHGRDFRMRSRWLLVFACTRRVVRWARRRIWSGDRVVVIHEHDHEHDERHLHHHADHAHGAVGEPHHAHWDVPAEPLVEHTAGASVATISPHRHRHLHQHVGTLPDDPFPSYGRATAFGVGVLHGVGAETPTQVLLFLGAARGGAVEGAALLVCFIVGLLAANTIVAATASIGLLGASRNFPVYATVSVVAAVFSVAVGTLFVLGQDALLHPILGG
jgi:hypothetical protein